MKLNHILKGKSRPEIISDFRSMYRISNDAMDNFLDAIQKDWRYMALLWEIPIMIIGVAVVGSAIYDMVEVKSILIYHTDITFFKRIVNIIWCISIISIGLSLVVVPLVKMGRRFKW